MNLVKLSGYIGLDVMTVDVGSILNKIIGICL
jgi:hypothetical protein